MASFLGVEAGEAVKRVARLLCAGGSNVAVQHGEYRGLHDLRRRGGRGRRRQGLHVGLPRPRRLRGRLRLRRDHDERATGCPVVDPALCTACGDCVEACPKDLFTIMPLEQKLIVQCKSLLEGEAAEALCRVACTACGRCVDDAAPGVIAIRGGLAVVDYAKNDQAGPEAIARCPTGAIAGSKGRSSRPARETAGSLSA